MPYYAYITSNPNRTVLYTGVTNNLTRRIYEHKSKAMKGFTAKYNVIDLLWTQEFPTALEAITAEKKIKGWTRAKKLALIQTINPDFESIPIE